MTSITRLATNTINIIRKKSNTTAHFEWHFHQIATSCEDFSYSSRPIPIPSIHHTALDARADNICSTLHLIASRTNVSLHLYNTYICSFVRSFVHSFLSFIRCSRCLLFLINFKCNRINGKMGGRVWMMWSHFTAHSLQTARRRWQCCRYSDAGAYFTLTYAHVHLRKISRTTDETKIELWKSKSNRNSVYPFGRFWITCSWALPIPLPSFAALNIWIYVNVEIHMDAHRTPCTAHRTYWH